MSESKIQHEIVKALRKTGALVFSVPNELAKSNAVAMGQAVAMGLWAGVSDLVVVLPGKVIFLEVKTESGKQSPKQIEFERRVKEMGHNYHVVRSVQESMEALS